MSTLPSLCLRCLGMVLREMKLFLAGGEIKVARAVGRVFVENAEVVVDVVVVVSRGPRCAYLGFAAVGVVVVGRW